MWLLARARARNSTNYYLHSGCSVVAKVTGEQRCSLARYGAISGKQLARAKLDNHSLAGRPTHTQLNQHLASSELEKYFAEFCHKLARVLAAS